MILLLPGVFLTDYKTDNYVIIAFNRYRLKIIDNLLCNGSVVILHDVLIIYVIM